MTVTQAGLEPIGTGRRPLVVLVGPSGAGKSSLARDLQGRGIVSIHPSWTTRPPRPNEGGGSFEHRFVSDHDFDELDHAGFFTARGTIHGLPYRYGIPAIDRGAEGPLDAVIWRARHIAQLRCLASDCLVYQVADTDTRIERRIATRGTTRNEVESRAADNISELSAGRRVAHRVFQNHGSLEGLSQQVLAGLIADTSATATGSATSGVHR